MSKLSSYRPAMDLARFLACFGIVAAHAFAMEDDWVGHLALALFLVLTAFLAVQSMQRAGGKYPFAARAKKLILPWLAWSLFFRIVALKVSDDPSKYQLLTDPWTLLIGSAIHLWFLPFVMLAMALVEPVGRTVTTPARLVQGLVALVVFAGFAFWLVAYFSPPAPILQWLFSLPIYMLGLLIGVAHPMRRAIWPGFAAMAMAAVAFAVSFATKGAAVAWWWVIPLAWLLFEGFWRLPLRGTALQKLLPKLGQAAFGIYLMHPFFMLVTYKFFGPNVDRLFATLLTFGMSWVCVMLLRRLPLFARLT